MNFWCFIVVHSCTCFITCGVGCIHRVIDCHIIYISFYDCYDTIISYFIHVYNRISQHYVCNNYNSMRIVGLMITYYTCYSVVIYVYVLLLLCFLRCCGYYNGWGGGGYDWYVVVYTTAGKVDEQKYRLPIILDYPYLLNLDPTWTLT